MLHFNSFHFLLLVMSQKTLEFLFLPMFFFFSTWLMQVSHVKFRALRKYVCALIDLAVHFDRTIYSCRNSVYISCQQQEEGCNSFSHTAWTGVHNSLKLQVFCGNVCSSMLMFWQVSSVGRRASWSGEQLKDPHFLFFAAVTVLFAVNTALLSERTENYVTLI